MMRWADGGCAPPANVLLPRFRLWLNILMMRHQRLLGSRVGVLRCFGMGLSGTLPQLIGASDSSEAKSHALTIQLADPSGAINPF